MSKIKILAISPTFYPVMGGAERTIYELYKRLPKYGYHTDLVTPNLGGREYEKICDGFEVYRVGRKLKYRLLKFIFYQLWNYLKIKELIKKKKYDLVHIHYGFPSLFLFYFAKLRLKKPVIITEHHFGTGMDISSQKENPFFINFILKKVYKNADKIVTLSKEQKNFVKSLCKRKDIQVISFGIDMIFFNPSKYDKLIKKTYNSDVIILTVSRLVKRKNTEEVIKVAEKIVKEYKKIKFLIIGTGKEKKNLEEIVKKKKLTENIIFLGFISDNRLPSYYATADIFILPSKYEGFGMVYLESMASGTPVISYNISAAREIIENSKNGYLVSNYLEMYSKLMKLIKNKKLLKKMSLEAVNIVRRKYNLSIMVEKYDKLFSKLVKNGW